MQLQWRTQEFEYRDARGVDQFAGVDVWSNASGSHVVLVLRGVPLNDARRALDTLNDCCLPYLVRPDARVLVLALRPADEGGKARALVMPLCA